MDLPSVEKASMTKPSMAADPCVKKLEVDLAVDTLQEQRELEELLLQEELMQELLEQQKMEYELSCICEREAFESDPVEQQRSLVNRTIPASSAVAPSALLSCFFLVLCTRLSFPTHKLLLGT